MPVHLDQEEINALRPHIEKRHPLRQSSHYDENFENEFHEWFLSFDVLDGEKEKQTFCATGYPYLVSVGWPRADRRRLFAICALLAVLTDRDRQVAFERGKIDEVELAMRPNYTHQLEPKWWPILNNVWHRFSEFLPLERVVWMAEQTAHWVQGSTTHEQRLMRGEPYRNLDEYFTLRNHSMGQFLDHDLVEVELGIDLGHQTRMHPLIQQLWRPDICRTVLLHDVLSLKKELLTEGQDMLENSVPIIAKLDGCSLSEALARAMNLYEDYSDQYDQARTEILKSELGERDDVRQYVDGLNDFNAGVLDWSIGSTRYTLEKHNRWGQVDEIVTG